MRYKLIITFIAFILLLVVFEQQMSDNPISPYSIADAEDGDYLGENLDCIVSDLTINGSTTMHDDFHVGSYTVETTNIAIYEGTSATLYLKDVNKSNWKSMSLKDINVYDDIVMAGDDNTISGHNEIYWANAGSGSYDSIRETLAETVTRGETIVKSGTSGEWYKSDSDLLGKTKNQFGIAAEAISAGSLGYIAIEGYFDYQSWNWPDFDPLFISQTAGDLTQTVVSGTGTFTRLAAYVSGSTSVFIYPSGVWTEN